MVRNRLDVYRDSVAGERITMLNGIVTRQSDAMLLLILLVVVMFAVSGAVCMLTADRQKLRALCLKRLLLPTVTCFLVIVCP